MMKPSQQSTTAFYTLDGCHSGLVSVVFDALVSIQKGSNEQWEIVCEHPRIQERFRTQGIDEFEPRSMISWDDPTLLFTLTRMLDGDNLPIMLGEDKNRERFGRFPHSTGSTIQYVRENVRTVGSQTNELYDDLVTHLDYLLTRCNSDNVGDGRYMDGKAGLNIMGFLTCDEVKTLRSSLLGGGWTVAKDEPIDGGVRDAMRHLNALLLAAERHNAGLIHRMHA
ncbi:MAG: hypothetical protein ACPG9D_00940 [Candidatus Poseidoniaceae archaeon]